MSTTDQYLDARSEYQRVSIEVHKLVGTLSKVAEAMKRNPSSVAFGGADYGFVHDVSERPSLLVSPENWPKAEDMQALLTRWREAKQKMEQAWASVPTNRRSGLEAPAKWNPYAR